MPVSRAVAIVACVCQIGEVIIGRAWLFAFVGGFVLSFVSCGERPCGPSTCARGCCGLDGQCSSGELQLECGSSGEACVRCSRSEHCEERQCLPNEVIDAGPIDAGPPKCRCTTSCCLPDGSCAPNTDPSACGAPGLFCGQCAAGERCQLGVCVATACGGCLDPLGQCRAGNTPTACGSAGGVCVACGADQACRSQRCVFTKCDETNCRFGCCRADLSCETGVSATACGASGARCVTCFSTESCVAGVCL